MTLPKIVYVRGGDKRAPDIARRGGMRYGSRNDYKAYAPVYMIDIKWENYDWAKYRAKVQLYQPQIAMVADYERPDQSALMLRQIEDLRALKIPRVMVCPKFPGAVQLIPADCIIAVSVPTGYAGFMPPKEELITRKIHLLGGHPDQQLYLMQLYQGIGAEVVSVDGNVLASKAMRGQYWKQSGGWQDMRGKNIPTDTLAVVSAINIRRYFAANRRVFTTRRVIKCAYDRLLI